MNYGSGTYNGFESVAIDDLNEDGNLDLAVTGIILFFLFLL